MEPTSDIRLRSHSSSTNGSNSPQPIRSLIPSRRGSGSAGRGSPTSSRNSPESETPVPFGPKTADEQWQYEYQEHLKTGKPTQTTSQVVI